jgi:hypothetical protein
MMLFVNPTTTLSVRALDTAAPPTPAWAGSKR